MSEKKPTYEELEKRIRELEKEKGKGRLDAKALKNTEKHYQTLFENIAD